MKYFVGRFDRSFLLLKLKMLCHNYWRRIGVGSEAAQILIYSCQRDEIPMFTILVGIYGGHGPIVL